MTERIGLLSIHFGRDKHVIHILINFGLQFSLPIKCIGNFDEDISCLFYEQIKALSEKQFLKSIDSKLLTRVFFLKFRIISNVF